MKVSPAGIEDCCTGPVVDFVQANVVAIKTAKRKITDFMIFLFLN
jgi:hypothetical protein